MKWNRAYHQVRQVASQSRPQALPKQYSQGTRHCHLLPVFQTQDGVLDASPVGEKRNDAYLPGYPAFGWNGNRLSRPSHRRLAIFKGKQRKHAELAKRTTDANQASTRRTPRGPKEF